VIELANQVGRLRWKIENEGFNVQSNGGYALEHTYTRHAVSAKVFHLLLQLAHTLARLIERGSLFRQAFPAGWVRPRTSPGVSWKPGATYASAPSKSITC